MEYGILGLCICFGALGYAEISKLKRQIKVQKEQILMLCEAASMDLLETKQHVDKDKL